MTFPLKAEKMELFETHEDWLKARRQAQAEGRFEIGGSVIAQIMGLQPFGKTEWDAKVGLSPQYVEHQEAMEEDPVFERGRVWESRVLDEYERLTGHIRNQADSIIQVTGREPWQRATVDDLVIDETLGFGVLEAKTSIQPWLWGKESGVVIDEWGEEYNHIVPAYYACQAYWYLDVTELPFCDIAVMLPKHGDFPETRWYRLMRDEETQEEIFSLVSEWRERFLINDEMPDLDASKAARRFLARRFPGETAKKTKSMRPANTEEKDLIDEYLAARGIEERARAEKERLVAEITMRIGDDYGLKFGPHGKHKAIWFPKKGRASIDKKAIERDHPGLLEDYTTRGDPSRSFRVYNNK